MEDESPISREGQFFDGYTWRNKDEAEDTSGQNAANSELAHELSERELQILRLMQGKLTAKQIATSLLVSHRTVQFHMDSMYWKLGCSGRGARDQAVARGRKLGIIK
jgi:ATP/maltotriose-dependent transcriptional regulator MalT